jgi:hypothetical protein
MRPTEQGNELMMALALTVILTAFPAHTIYILMTHNQGN